MDYGITREVKRHTTQLRVPFLLSYSFTQEEATRHRRHSTLLQLPGKSKFIIFFHRQDSDRC